VQVISAGSGIVGRVDLRIGILVLGCGATVVVVTTTAGVVVVVTGIVVVVIGTVVVGAELLESNIEYASRF
jgi:hypothetical protein